MPAEVTVARALLAHQWGGLDGHTLNTAGTYLCSNGMFFGRVRVMRQRKVCAQCGRAFIPEFSTQTLCSDQCFDSYPHYAKG